MTTARERIVGAESLRRQCVSVPMTYVDVAGGDLAAGVLLAQIIYWFSDKKNSDESRVTIQRDGRPWLAKRWTDWYKECRLTEDQARRCARILVDEGLVDQDVFRWKGSPTTHLTINWEVLGARIEAAQIQVVQNPDPSGTEPRSNQGKNPEPLYTETTAETTNKKKRGRAGKRAAEPVPIPDPPADIDSPDLRAFLPEWSEYRAKVKRLPMATKRMWTLLFAHLRSAGRDNAVVALKYAMAKSWKGFEFPWLQGKSWAEVRSEIGEPERRVLNPPPSLPADRALEEAKDRAIAQIRSTVLTAADGWHGSARSLIETLIQDAPDVATISAICPAALALDSRLRSLGAYPLRRTGVYDDWEPGLLFSKSGSKWRVTWNGEAFEVSPGGLTLPSETGHHECAITIDDPAGDNPSPEAVEAAYSRVAAFRVDPRAKTSPGGVLGIPRPPTQREIEYGQRLAAEVEGSRPRAGLSSAELAAIDPPNPDFFEAVSGLPPLDVSGFEKRSWNWTGPADADLQPDGQTLKSPVPGERWPYGPPEGHEDCCGLHGGGLFCDCKASAHEDDFS